MSTRVRSGALIEDAPTVEAVADAVADAGSAAVDLEFMTEGFYIPELSLVQVAWGDIEDPVVVAIDPLAVSPEPVIEVLADPEVEVIVHAAQADLALLSARFDLRLDGLIDTQIAAAFVGMGEQISYGAMIERVLDLQLDKGAQFTEWSRRPLSDDQLSYALDDVRHLPAAWERLRTRLDGRGRLEWVAEECQRLASTWAERTPPDEIYRRVRGWNQLRPASLGALRALAAWRERESLRVNRPPSRLMHDRTLLEVCRRPPRTTSDLREVRGLGAGVVQRYGEEMLDELERGAQDPPPLPPRPEHTPRIGQAWPAVLGGIVQTRAREERIAARFIATRSDLEEVISWWLTGDRDEEPELPLLGGWRRGVAGDDILDWLAGRTTIAVDGASESGVRIVVHED
jgi:ribonuclease D